MKPILALFSLLIFAAVACGAESALIPTAEPASTRTPNTSDTAPSGVAVPTPTPLVEPTPRPRAESSGSSGQPIDGGTLVRLGPEPPTLDPHLTGDTYSALYIVEIFGGLMTINKDLEVVGDLAESWEMNENGANITFHLRRNATFHDGRPVTASDVKWSIERATDPATLAPTADVFLGDIVGAKDKLAGAATQVSGVRVIDNRTVALNIGEHKAYFISKLTYPTSYVLDQNNVTGNANWTLSPNGTGPFELAEYSPGETLRLTRFGNYHLGPAKVDEVRFILSGGNARLMYENDEIHTTGLGLVGLEGLLDPSNPLSAEVVRAPPGFDVTYFGMNVTESPFDDPKVRQAFNHAIDRQSLATALLEDLVVPATGILPPGFPGFNRDLEGYEFDPVRARRLLSESKYGNNLEDLPRITLTLPGSFGSALPPYIEAILDMWEQNLGVRTELLQTEWAIFLQDLHQQRFQMFGGLGWIADYPDPENFLDGLFHSESSNNQSEYSNPEVDRLLERARTERDEDTRFALYNEVEELIMADSPWITLWHANGGYLLAKPNVNDYFLFPLVIPRFRYVYFTEE